jgi:hypothetical protein
MILEDQYRKYLQRRDLAQNTIDNYVSSVKRVERENNVDLEKEFAKDHAKSLMDRLVYTRDDERAGKPNPTSIAIPPEKLYSYLAWYRAALGRYLQFRQSGDNSADASLIEDAGEPEEVAAAGNSFRLEEDLQKTLRENISQLELGLMIEDGGKEYQVEAGFIDILARDKSGQWVVIELKAGDARPDAVAQILSYMSCIADLKKAPTRGILIAADFVPRVRLAARAVPNLALQKYRFNFSFEKA